MAETLRILILEDNPDDAELVTRELRKHGFLFDAKRVDTKELFVKALTDFKPDIILADYNLPSFDGYEALELAHDDFPGIPFIFVSGSLGEETAIETLKLGAADYVLKTNLARLVPVVKRALKEAAIMRERKELLEEIESKCSQLQKFYQLSVGRELKMTELKQHIKELEEKLSG